MLTPYSTANSRDGCLRSAAVENLSRSRVPRHPLLRVKEQLTDALNSLVKAISDAANKINAQGNKQSPALPDVGEAPTTTSTDVPDQIDTGDSSSSDSSGGGSSLSFLGSFKQAITGLIGGGKDGLKGLTSMVGSVVSGFGNFLSTITGAKSGAAGALGGAMSGLSLGMQLGGPMGGAIGAAGGALAGFLTGNKAEQVNNESKKMQTAFDNVVQSLNMGSTKLGDAINQLKQIEQQTIQQLSGSKKGRQQLPGILAGMNQQIEQLQAQQKQLLNQLAQQTAILSDPMPYQDVLNSLDAIIQKYQQFADAAAGNAQQVAEANNFLTESLKNYAETQAQQMNQSEQDAVQNAINLNQLLVQRQQLLDQEKRSEYDIMTQGALTSARTKAMQGVSQIAELRAQTAQQLQTLNQQIAVSQYKYDIEQKIFNLQTTAVGLQMQLVALQNQQTDFETAKISALADVLNKLNSTDLSNLTNFNQIMAMLGMTQAGGTGANWQAPNANGRTPSIPGGYYNTVGYNTPFPTNYQTGLPVDQTPGLPSYDVGGIIPTDQIAKVHKGEEVVKVSDKATILSTMKNIANSTLESRGVIEGQIHNQAMQRIAVEKDLVSSQKEYAAIDIQRIGMLSALVDKLNSSGAGTGAGNILETAISQLYSVRGRYGSGGFNREFL